MFCFLNMFAICLSLMSPSPLLDFFMVKSIFPRSGWSFCSHCHHPQPAILPYSPSTHSDRGFPASLAAGWDHGSQFWLMGCQQKRRMQLLGRALETGRPALPAHRHFGGLIPAPPSVLPPAPSPPRTVPVSHLGQWGQRMCLQDVEKSRRNLHYNFLNQSLCANEVFQV